MDNLVYDNSTFQSTNIFTLEKFASFLERYDVITLEKEIKSKTGNILVQSERPLTENFLKSLKLRDDIENNSFIIKTTENLRSAIVNKISKEFNKKLDLADFSFCAYLHKKNSLDIFRVIRAAFNNSFFLGFCTLTFYNQSNILDHLTEIALLTLGLLNMTTNQVSTNDYIKMFQAAMLHDFSIMEEKKWFQYESFDESNTHDRESAMQISNKELSPDIADIILTHNHLQKSGGTGGEENWYSNNTELMATILNLAEYYTFLKRTIALNNPENSDYMNKVFFQLSQIIEKGYFPAALIVHFKKHYTKYNTFFEYGKNIAEIENMCIHSDLARAYPKPKATQLLCINSSKICEHRIYSQPLKVVLETSSGDKLFNTLATGWYDKCNFAKNLPKPPNDL